MPKQMTADEFRRLLEHFDLNHTLAAQLLAVEKRTIRRYASGESEVTQQITMILRLLRRHKITPDSAFKLATGRELR